MKNNFNWFLESYNKILDKGYDIYHCFDYCSYEDTTEWYFLLPKKEADSFFEITFKDIELLENYQKLNSFRRKIPLNLITNKKIKLEAPNEINKSTLDTLLKQGFSM